MIKFGVASTPVGFSQAGFKKSEQMPEYMASLGLNAFEYQCSRGVRVNDENARKLREASEKYDITLGVHAPYYISLSTQEEEKQQATIRYITDTMQAAKKMGAKEIVVHAGALLGLERGFAVGSACQLLKRAYEVADDMGLSDVIICPETMGKVNQLGSSEEIVQMCLMDERLKPTIDFGHLYCRKLGTLQTYEDWKKELQIYIDGLGYERMKQFHSHFSHMEYTVPGGEKRHVNFADKGYGPDFAVIAKVLLDLHLEPTIFCESAGSQDIDAVEMKRIYEQIKKEEIHE